MHTFDIYYENADTDEPRKWIGRVNADTGGQALQKASEWWEVPGHDLVAVQLTPNTVFNPLAQQEKSS